jgi:hypothetical protein
MNAIQCMVVVLACLAGSALGAETNIRTARSDTTITVGHNREVTITYVLRRTDRVYLSFRGTESRLHTGAQLIANAASVTNLGDGRFRVRVSMVGYRELNGASLVLRSSSGTLIDSDRISIQ